MFIFFVIDWGQWVEVVQLVDFVVQLLDQFIFVMMIFVDFVDDFVFFDFVFSIGDFFMVVVVVVWVERCYWYNLRNLLVVVIVVVVQSRVFGEFVLVSQVVFVFCELLCFFVFVCVFEQCDVVDYEVDCVVVLFSEVFVIYEFLGVVCDVSCVLQVLCGCGIFCRFCQLQKFQFFLVWEQQVFDFVFDGVMMQQIVDVLFMLFYMVIFYICYMYVKIGVNFWVEFCGWEVKCWQCCYVGQIVYVWI